MAEAGGGADHGDKVYSIKVNGRTRDVAQKKVSYRDVVMLAFPDADFERYLFVAMYIKGEGGHESDLVEGETVPLKDGMIFNVRKSDKS